ncbi:MAG TPA: hypothetical protein VEX86_15045 [Longimicrobium sp.]|nr:hypothetical protein [Longimicrobium sp.]
MLPRSTRSKSITLGDFHADLAEFAARAEQHATVGDAETFGGKPWVWIEHAGRRSYLNADTTADAVDVYLGLRDAAGGELDWSVVPNRAGRMNKVAFGPDQLVIPGFYLYFD